MNITDLTDIVQTCDAFPSQWDAKTPDGRNVYVRYRGGTLSVWVSMEPDGPAFGHCIFGEAFGGDYDGICDWPAVVHVVGRLDFRPPASV